MLFLQKWIGRKTSGRAFYLGHWRLAFMGLVLALAQGAQAVPAQHPLFLTHSVTPVMMLTMDKDHQLYLKAYDDYSDFTDSHKFKEGSTTVNEKWGGSQPDGEADITYVHKYQYYGYFDSQKCYNYTNERFEPANAVDADGYCNGKWSGNFLNWATMTRIDIVRKILYGGLRSTDEGPGITVLERAFLPNDAHSFAKYYNGNDIAKLTPHGDIGGSKAQTSGITLCNTTTIDITNNNAYANMSQQTNALAAPPKIRVAKGNFSLWASSERWQCLWDNGFNGNDYNDTDILASEKAPTLSGAKLGTYIARVKVCVSGMEESNCKRYEPATYANKPTGLLQKYGETNELNFGLITGSYGRNKSGGVLRKNVGNMLDEINTTSYGTFKAPPTTQKDGKTVYSAGELDGRIISTLNRLRLYGYNFAAGHYWDSDSAGDNCKFHVASFSDANNGSGCSNWGNPQSEIYYEALRYLAGAKATDAYSRTGNPDSNYITGLTQVPWSAPITTAKKNYCAPLSILQFSGTSSSYDSDGEAQYPNTTDIGISDINALTDAVGVLENITARKRFVGKINGATKDGNHQLCTAKQVDKLSNVNGICPESPRLDGGYTMVGLARYARKTGIPLIGVGKTNTVRTFSVALAPAVPKVEVPVPGSTTGQKVIIQPACRNTSSTLTETSNTVVPTNCAIVDFKVVSQRTYTRTTAGNGFPAGYGSEGKLYVNWEDGEQGGDYDQDMWGIVSYFITDKKVYITTQVLAKSTTQVLGFGYILSGTGTVNANDEFESTDGFHVQSGVNYFQHGTSCVGTSGKPGTECTCIDNSNTLTSKCDRPFRTQIFDVAPASATDATFMESPLYYAAKWGGYSTEFATTNANTIEEPNKLDTTIRDGKPAESFFYATNPNNLAAQLDTAFLAISADRGVASGVATNNYYLKSGTYIFRSEFNSFNWSGMVKAFAVDDNGDLAKTDGEVIAKFSTTDANRIPAPDARNIYVNNLSPVPGFPAEFTWDNLHEDQKPLLQLSTETTDANAKLRVNWLRGSPDNEGVSKFRIRTAANKERNVLGDLIDSSPVYVGAIDYHYDNFSPGTEYRDYVLHKSDGSQKNKTPKIFVGGNDGMVHAFNATSNSNDILKEMYAFIPSSVFSKLANLTRPDYGKPINPHQYLVDGPIATGDVYIGDKWRTIIVGTLGAGGKGIYALEVMNSEADSDVTDTKPRLLFELTPDNLPGLGYVMGTPVIAPMANGRWAVVFGNGDDTGTTSKLFVVDIAEPLSDYTRTIDTKTGTGLSAAALVPDSRGRAIAAYAGDLKGNMWRFDLSDSDEKKWETDYLLFKAVDSTGTAQPIFAAPTLGINTQKDNKFMVYFGTGKYYDTGDNEAIVKPQNSFYAILDIGAATSTGANPSPASVSRGDLLQKFYEGADRKIITGNPNWNERHGWYLDLGGTADDMGERVTTTALLIEDKLIFPTLISSVDPCANGGGSWLMEVTAVGNKFPNSKPALEKNTFRSGLILGNISIAKSGTGARVLGSTTDAKLPPIDEKVTLNPSTTGRQSWRQVR